jgi:hypothetical protein
VSKLYTHEQALELLPWFVNGTLAEDERVAVERHVRNCLPCRVALQEQHQLGGLLKQQPTVPLSAEVGFERLLAEIDAARRPPGEARTQRLARFASVTALAASLVLAVWLVIVGGDARRDATFVTATDPSSGYVGLDIVFAPQVSEAELRALIQEIDGVITGGPSEIGRYRVRLPSQDAQGADEIVERLRNDARVRFVARAYATGDEP